MPRRVRAPRHTPLPPGPPGQPARDPLRIAFVTSEMASFAKTGGLADVSAALPRELQRAGHDVRVFMPLYARVREQGVELRPVPGIPPFLLTLGSRRYPVTLRTARLPGSELDVYFIDCPPLFERPGIYTQDADEHLRFLLLSRATIECLQRAQWGPDILHCNDWQTALVPLYLRSIYAWDKLFANTRTVLTIHNLGYQGGFGADILPDLSLGDAAPMLHQDDLRAGRIGFLKHGLLYADVLTTVSPGYAEEIRTEAHGVGLHALLAARASAGALVGILNGIDDEIWNPLTDPHIATHYSVKSLARKAKNKSDLLARLGLSADKEAPLAGFVSRLSAQKGVELLLAVLPGLLQRTTLRFAALGSGEPSYEAALARLQLSFPGRVCFFRGFSEELAHCIEAGSDLFLMPSLYEPCGLNQMYSLRYGTVPVVRRTGGLADTVDPWSSATSEGTGFLFDHFTAEGLRWALGRALSVFEDRKAWRRLQTNGMLRDFSWRTQCRRYIELYERLHGRSAAPAAPAAPDVPIARSAPASRSSSKPTTGKAVP